ICYVAAGHPGNLESLTRALQSIRLALPRFLKLSNWAAREFDVSLGPDGGRKIFSKITLGNELRAWRRADAKIGDLAWPGRVSTGPERRPGIAGIAKLANSIRPTGRWPLPNASGIVRRFPPELFGGRRGARYGAPR